MWLGVGYSPRAWSREESLRGTSTASLSLDVYLGVTLKCEDRFLHKELNLQA